MDFELHHKCFLVTGASRGIGKAIATRLLEEGAKVALISRGLDSLKQTILELSHKFETDRVIGWPADCADEIALRDIRNRIVHNWGCLDGVVANVGDGRSVPDALPDCDQFSKVWRTNFTTAEVTARATLPLLSENKGCLLFISSIAGLESIGAPTDYSVAKSALIALTKQLARKLAPSVRVNCLAPGNVLFPGGSWDTKIQADPKRIEALINSTVPMKRFGTPQEIADAAVFLCSARASFITGACLVVDGGQTVGFF